MIKVAIITISDRASRGEYEDRSGLQIQKILDHSEIDFKKIIREIVPDEAKEIKRSINNNLDKDFIITTGGTGLSARDITPEVTQSICDKPIPGISEMLRFESLKETLNAVLSRGYCGLKGKTVIINLPGSVKGASFCTELLIPIFAHAKAMIAGKKH